MQLRLGFSIFQSDKHSTVVHQRGKLSHGYFFLLNTLSGAAVCSEPLILLVFGLDGVDKEADVG